MRYQGGKVRQAARIVPHILAADPVRYIEPFVGGASVACKMVESGFTGPMVLSDTRLDLILLWCAGLDGWEPPAELTRDEYAHLKTTAASPLRGWAALAASHSQKWWGGYGVKNKATGRDYLAEMRRSYLRDAATLRQGNVSFEWRSYADHYQPNPGDVIYADPPYAGTTGYGETAPFDSDAFWTTAAAWLTTNCVFVSEFAAPASWTSVQNTERGISLNAGDYKRAAEHLFGGCP